jgi:hypothetical protein
MSDNNTTANGPIAPSRNCARAEALESKLAKSNGGAVALGCAELKGKRCERGWSILTGSNCSISPTRS